MRQTAEGTWSILYRISRKKSPASRGNIADGTKKRFGYCRKELYFSGKNFIFQERTLFFIYKPRAAPRVTIALMRDVLVIGIQKAAIDDFEHRLFHSLRPAQ
jgi:hypothetical protein